MLSQYDYTLPEELIAQEPLRNRSDSRLLVVNRSAQSFQHCSIRNLPEFVGPKDCLVLNNTRVLPARLIGWRTKTGAPWDGLFVQSGPEDCWQIIGKTQKIKVGETVLLHSPDGKNEIIIEFVMRNRDGTWMVRPIQDPAPQCVGSASSLLRQIGWTPIPPYIRKGKPRPYDEERYQTVYAEECLQGIGSVAAPTAGLHLTPELLHTIKERGTAVTPVTLHVGLGTFKPIVAENIEEHTMHAEWCSLPEASASVIEQRRKSGGRIVAVGTTAVRTLESAPVPMCAFEGQTSLFIRPPYSFRNVDVLLTNFHFPKSTLLILVRTFGGEELIRSAYDEAVRLGYRFFSYGDAMLIC